MSTIDRMTLKIEPGETATAYIPLPLGCTVEKVDVDPRTAGAFKIKRADYIGPSAMLAETGVRAPALRVELENVSATAQPARIFVDVGTKLASLQRSLAGAAEQFNRDVFDARRRRGLN